MPVKPCFIIAEAGVNHNGSLGLAKELVCAAAEAGADAIKFQTFQTDLLTTAGAMKAAYQRSGASDSCRQADMLRELELAHQEFVALKEVSDQHAIEFMSTAFDVASLALLANNVGLKRVKIPSGEIVNGPLLLAAARTRLPLIISTGMSSLDEVEECLSIVLWGREHQDEMPSSRAELRNIRNRPSWLDSIREDIWLMHCVTQYPAPVGATSLRSIDYLRDQTGLPTGLSDHSIGSHVAVAAVARGACVLEKHFTLSRRLPGPDHPASLEPDELSAMIRAIRDVEEALGQYGKQPHEVELENLEIARGCLVASARIRKGDRFTRLNTAIKRSGKGITPFEYWDYIAGRIADRDYFPDERIVA